MGDNRTPRVVFHLTSFSKFRGVTDNPSERILRQIPRFFEQHKDGAEFPFDVHIASCTVLETSAQACRDYFSEIPSYLTADADWNVLLHFGVSPSAHSFEVETCGRNVALFRSPDQRGFNPKNEAISLDRPFLEPLFTEIPVGKLVARLQAKQPRCVLSSDPGEFVCNFCYYLSLVLVDEFRCDLNVSSLFVHVPPFFQIKEQEQLEFAHCLMHEIAAELLRRPRSTDLPAN